MADGTLLIDRTLIRDAAAKLIDVRARLASARATLAGAEKDASAASDAAVLAVAHAAGGGAIDTLAAGKSVADAEAHRDFHRRVVALLETEEAAATAAHAASNGKAHTLMYLAGVRARLAAAAKGDQARALLAEAEADHERATGLIRRAHGEGCGHPEGINGGMLQMPLRTEAAERALWEGHL